MNSRYAPVLPQSLRSKSLINLKVLILYGLLNSVALYPSAQAQQLPTSSSIISLALAPSVESLKLESFYDRVNASMCSQCHGTYGQSAEGSKIPSLAGQSTQELLTKLQKYQASEPSSSVMARLVRGLSAQQLLTTVEYFADRSAFFEHTTPKPKE